MNTEDVWFLRQLFLSGIKKNKDKYRLTVKSQKIFSIAGIFREYKSQETRIRHVSMLTTEAKGLMSEIHTRMPIILPQSFEKIYLTGKKSWRNSRVYI